MIRRQITKRIDLVVDFKPYLEDIDTGKKVFLSDTEFETIEKLTNPADRDYADSELGKAFSKDEFWEPTDDKKKMLRTRISRARKKLDEVFQGAGKKHIKRGYNLYRFVSDIEHTAFRNSSFSSEVDIANIFEKLDRIMREIEDIQAKIDSDTTRFRLKKHYYQHLDVLLFRYDQLHKEALEKSLEVERLRNNYRANETVSGTSTLTGYPECEMAVLKQHLEDLGAWASGAVSAMDLLSYELDEAIRAFINDNIDDLSTVFDALPENKQTTHVLLDCVDTFDSCAELYETLFERKSYLEPEELEKLINRAKKNFDPQQWSLWDMED